MRHVRRHGGGGGEAAPDQLGVDEQAVAGAVDVGEPAPVAWRGRANPVPQARRDVDRRALSGGRDAPARGPRAPFRMRVPRELPRTLSAELAEELICRARSARDKAILALLLGSGQRIGDWPDIDGRHGVLGMCAHDVDEQRGLVTVRLKGSRDEHRVPVTRDFWPLLRRYVREERAADAPMAALWVGFRRGAGRPLRARPAARRRIGACGGAAPAGPPSGYDHHDVLARGRRASYRGRRADRAAPARAARSGRIASRRAGVCLRPGHARRARAAGEHAAW